MKEFGEGVDRMCRELEAADCGDVRYRIIGGFMLQATALNRIGRKAETANIKKMADSNANIGGQNLAVEPKVGVSTSKSDQLEAKVIDSVVESDSLESKVSVSNANFGSMTNPNANFEGQNLAFHSPHASFANKDSHIVIVEEFLSKSGCQEPTKKKITKLFHAIADNEVFGVRNIVAILSCPNSTARWLMTLMRDLELVIPVKGQGKGRYMFKDLTSE